MMNSAINFISTAIILMAIALNIPTNGRQENKNGMMTIYRHKWTATKKSKLKIEMKELKKKVKPSPSVYFSFRGKKKQLQVFKRT